MSAIKCNQNMVSIIICKTFKSVNGNAICSCCKCQYGERDAEQIIACVLNKIENKDFVDMFSPLYLKKSQAEREIE